MSEARPDGAPEHVRQPPPGRIGLGFDSLGKGIVNLEAQVAHAES